MIQHVLFYLCTKFGAFSPKHAVTIIFYTNLLGCNKHLSDYYPNNSMLHNPEKQKQPATLQHVDCNRNLNLIGSLVILKESLQLNGPLRNYKLNYLNSSRSDTVERNEIKEKTTA